MLTPHILKKQVDCYMQSLRFPKDAQVEMALSSDYPVMFHVEASGWHAKCLIAPCIRRD
jgi:hypothetical protein